MRHPRRTRGNPIVASAVDTRHSNASPLASPAKKSGARSPSTPRMNSVAHEVAVLATGARPSKTGERELFTEETTTVLVFESGGVLRLSAAVVPGQLLFLTNKGTRREVVAQVTRKRDFKPTSCYVEVEFSEPSPGFWGIDFPEMPPLAPANAQQKEAAELVHSAKVISGEPSAPVPSALEVTALKQEVEALREQLKLLQTQTAAGNSSAPAVAADSPPAPAIADAPSEPPANLPSAISEAPASDASNTHHVSAALPRERGGPSFSEGAHLPRPVIRVNRADTAHLSAKLNVGTGVKPRAKVFRIALFSSALLLAATGAAWYQHWIPWSPQSKKISASASPSITVNPAPAASAAPTRANSDSPKTTKPLDSPAPQPTVATQEATKFAPAGEAKLSMPAVSEPLTNIDSMVDPVAGREKSTLATAAAKRATARPSIKTASDSVTLPSQGVAVVQPKLIKAVRAIASPSALEYFARDKTATVTLDAIVDATGRVKAMKVVAGPASLRDSAMDALKQYRYEPATQRGKPVAAHVTVAIKFLFEP
jgi:protein TonB